MVCFIQQVKTLSWLDIAIVTGLEAKTMEEVPQDSYSSWVTMPLRGLQKNQPIVTLSSYEAEYVPATSCVCHAIWLRSMLKELHMEQEDATEIYVDNNPANDLAKNPVYHDQRVVVQRPKHALGWWLQPKRTLRWLHNSGGEEVEMMEMKVVAASDMVVMLEAVRAVTEVGWMMVVVSVTGGVVEFEVSA
ncbi:retrovirus-related pol polyprotein from transposon TNT 1-94 [Tanacetum coccineum]